jgi:hypothetical protein
MQTIYLLSFKIKIKGIIFVHIEHKLSYAPILEKASLHFNTSSKKITIKTSLYTIYLVHVQIVHSQIGPKSTPTFCDQYFWKFPIWNSRADGKHQEIRMVKVFK